MGNVVRWIRTVSPKERTQTRKHIALPLHGKLALRNQRGDTLVEVLIAVAVVSLVLVGAYGITSQSTTGIQDTQEHQEATSLVNRQLELIRNGGGLAAEADCFNDAGTAATGNGCNYDQSGNSGCTTSGQTRCYTVVVNSTRGSVTDADPTIPVTYTVRVTWDRLGSSSAQGSVSMLYKIAQVNPTYVPSPPAPGGAADAATITGSASSCVPGDACYTPGGSIYHFNVGQRVVSYSIADSQIQSCTWDWGDGTAVTYQVSQNRCYVGQNASHSYASAPEMQSLPPWPIACWARASIPGSQGIGGTRYTITFTLHTVSGRDVRADLSSVYLPLCWTP